MKPIFGILGMVAFGLAGMFLGGAIDNWAVSQMTFEDPDSHGRAILFVNLGVAIGMSLIGLVFGLWLAGKLRDKFIRTEA